MNCWNFTGNLGKDAETRFTTDGTAIVSFSVAVKSGYGDKAQTLWPRCSMFGKRGEAVAQYLTKGQQVAISGEVSMSEWQDREGQTRTSLDVRVSDLTLVGRRDDSVSQTSAQDTQQRQQRPQAPQRNQYAEASGGSMADLDSDAPF